MSLMVLKQPYRWGYRTLVAEVSDSIDLRRFCRIALSERVPDESTVRKLTRRIGPETVLELTRCLIAAAVREKRFCPWAVRIDSTVVEADVRYPTDAGLASGGVRVLGREGRKLAKLLGAKRRRVRDRSRAMGHVLRSITRTIRRRSGEAKAEVLKLTADTGRLLERSITEACKLAAVARRKARGRGASAKLKAAEKLDELAARCEKVVGQIKQRVAGEAIKDRIVSISDPDARPIRKGKLGKPNEFGYVTQLAEVTENTRRGARGLILPASTTLGQPPRGRVAAQDGAGTQAAWDLPREVALDGGVQPGPTAAAFAEIPPDRMFVAGRQQPGSKRTQAAYGATGPARRAGSATSNGATAWTDPASKTSKVSRSGLSGESSPTTPTRSPSGRGETLKRLSRSEHPLTTNGRGGTPPRPFRLSLGVNPRQVTKRPCARQRANCRAAPARSRRRVGRARTPRCGSGLR